MKRVAGVTLLLVLGSATARAQEPRLAGRLPESARQRIESVIDSARALGLPTEPLIDRALEGSAKGASPDLIANAVVRLRDELVVVRTALGESASTAELTAGASALRAGARANDLARLRSLRSGRPVTIAAAVLADLVAAGVPADTALGAVLAIARDAEDADYIAFRRSVQGDIEQGASPAAALAVRLRAVTESDVIAPGTGQNDAPRRPRKP